MAIANLEMWRHVRGIFEKTLRALIFIIAVLSFAALQPSMPQGHLDPSWQLGLNQAIAQGLVYGRDIVFTLGPYASVYTELYHPATDALMLWATLYLGISFGVVLTLVTRTCRWHLLLAVLVVLSTF